MVESGVGSDQAFFVSYRESLMGLALRYAVEAPWRRTRT